MTNLAPPSIDPASRFDLVGTLRLVLNKFLQGVDDMLPAKVIAYDRAANRARVQPLIAMVTTDNRQISRAQIASVPVLQLGGGGFVLSFPLQTGDLGWIKASDRDIAMFLKTLDNASPVTARKHSFSDALFIPDTFFKSVVIDGDDATRVVLQSLDGTTKIAMGNGVIDILATSGTVAITSTNLTHNGKNIGSTHLHSGVQTGSGDTGPPV